MFEYHHAGPVYEEFDPILKKRNFFGRHVNQAARIEPIVLPGFRFCIGDSCCIDFLPLSGFLILNMLGILSWPKISVHILYTFYRERATSLTWITLDEYSSFL